MTKTRGRNLANNIGGGGVESNIAIRNQVKDSS
jgi:hypothetical protein